MIKINLLPENMRPKEYTPPARLGLILANVAVGVGLAAIIGIEILRVIQLTGEHKDLLATLKKLEPKVKEYNELNDKNFKLTGKLKEIRSIAGRSVEWWKVVDALWDVINDNPRVWIDDITYLDSGAANGARGSYDAGRGASPPPYGISMNCHSAGLDLLAMTKFREALRTHPFLSSYFAEINFSVDWNVEEQGEYVERYSLSFRIQMIGADKPMTPVKAPEAAAPKGAQ